MEGLYAGFKEEKKHHLVFQRTKLRFQEIDQKGKNDVTFGIIKALKQKSQIFFNDYKVNFRHL